MYRGQQKAEVWEAWKTGTRWTLEPKFDGYRLSVIITNEGIVSYHCKEAEQPIWAENCTHIGDALLGLGKRGVMFDGEAMAKNWGETSSLLRRKRSLMDEETKRRVRDEVRFHCFDMVDLTAVSTHKLPGKRKTFSMAMTPLRERYAALQDELECYPGRVVRLVPQIVVTNDDELQAAYADLLAQGYEGGMAKDLDGPYVFDRSPFWLKLKPWKDIELTVIEAVEGVGKHAGRLGAFTCRTDEGVIASCGGGFSDKQREDYWRLWLADPSAIVGLRFEAKVQDSDVSATRHCNFKRERPKDC